MPQASCYQQIWVFGITACSACVQAVKGSVLPGPPSNHFGSSPREPWDTANGTVCSAILTLSSVLKARKGPCCMPGELGA